MALTDKALRDVVTALNSGELTMDDLLANLETKTMYVRRGASFSQLNYEGVSAIGGEFAKVFTVESKRIDRAGNEIVRQSRNGDDGE